jgi:hypothetical protein
VKRGVAVALIQILRVCPNLFLGFFALWRWNVRLLTFIPITVTVTTTTAAIATAPVSPPVPPPSFAPSPGVTVSGGGVSPFEHVCSDGMNAHSLLPAGNP